MNVGSGAKMVCDAVILRRNDFMRNIKLPYFKSIYITFGLLAIFCAFIFSFSNDFIFKIGHFGIGMLGVVMVLLRLFFKEKDLGRISWIFISINVIGAIYSFFQ